MIAGFVMVISALAIMFKVIHEGATKSSNSNGKSSLFLSWCKQKNMTKYLSHLAFVGDPTMVDDFLGVATTIQGKILDYSSSIKNSK